MAKLYDYLRLVRPANIVTSVADVWAGIAISGFFMPGMFTIQQVYPVFFLSLSTIGLYGGGIVFNDVFDAGTDKVERPERPIPSGVISISKAVTTATLLFLVGIAVALFVNTIAGSIALLIAFFALLYDKYSKHHPFIGPLNMGLCRGLNLLLGISISTTVLLSHYQLALIPVLYIFSITLISQGEVHGSGRTKLYIAALLYATVTAALLYFGYINSKLLFVLPFTSLFVCMIFFPLIKAIKLPVGKNIGKAVKAGVLSLILMDAAWAAGFHSLYAAFFIAALLPLSILLAKYFAVT